MTRQSKILVAAGALALLLILSPMKSSAETIIKQFEGLRLKAYPDGGAWSIGYGSQYNYDAGRAVISTDVISAPTALKWLKMRNDENRQFLAERVLVPINANQRNAMLSLMYNIGTPAFRGSTLLKKLNARAPIREVADQFDRWIYSQGNVVPELVKRRALEKQLFLS